jgi:glycyl-tRNA synthetase beta chain
MKDLLLEIGCENLPPASIQPAFEQLKTDAAKRLEELRLPFEGLYATGAPRRLVLIVRGVAAVQAAKTELVTGPPVSKAYDEKGEPTLTATGFARSHGVSVADLKRVRTERGEYVGFTKKLSCGKANVLLRKVLPELVAGLKFPKVMRWEKTGTRFARPIRWIVCLYGETVIPIEIAGVKSGSVTYVQPWLKPGRHKVHSADHYLATLRRAGILVDHEERYRAIETLAKKTAEKHGVDVIEDPDLMSELTFMLEAPHVLVGDFDKRYLGLPPEVVTTAMKAHQRYLALRAKGKKLVPMFLTFTEGKVGSPAVVRRGNERVLRARLEDALFYWHEDLETGIDGLSRKLETIVFIEGVGSLKDKAERLAALGRLVSEMGAPEARIPDELIHRAALLAKADLASEMVKDGKEFTLLEGLIGSHYALEANEQREVVAAIREHYLPRSPSDPLPRTPLGVVLGIADRVDTVSGCFLAGLIPSGSQDPYALRRQAMGLVRMLEHTPSVAIAPLVRASVDAYVRMGLGGNREPSEVVARIGDFFRNRTETFLKDKGITHDVVGAVSAVSWSTPGLALRRAKAIQHLRGNRAFELLITGAKRVGNILSRDLKTYGAGWDVLEDVWLRGAALVGPAPGGGPMTGGGRTTGASRVRFDTERFEDEAERALYEEIRKAIPRMIASDAASDFASVFGVLSELGPTIDRYFERVLVNCPDPVLRANRHQFLAAAFALFSRYADFSHIVEEGKASVA